MSMHPTRNLFKEFPNRVFIETGAYRGDGVQLAIDAGFEEIISMDAVSENIQFCHNRFGWNPDGPIHIVLGDSAEKLCDWLMFYKESITFWLDAHAQYLEDEPEYDNPYPLLAELEQISRHAIRTHTILIDDILHLTHPDITGWSRETIEEALRLINPDYQFTYYANPVKNNILVAHI